MKIKYLTARLLLLGMVGVLFSPARAEDPPRERKPPPLSDAQRSCLQGKMGVPGSGPRPSMEQMEAHLKEWG